MMTAHHTMTVWLERAARAMDEPDGELPMIALHARAAIVDTCHALLDEAARAWLAHIHSRQAPSSIAPDGIELFLLQHRLDPGLARAGADALSARCP